MLFQTYNNLFDLFGIGNATTAIILLLIFWFSFGAIASFFVYKDIKKREKSGINYVILVLFTSIIGLLVYYIVRYNEKCELKEEETCAIDDPEEFQEEFNINLEKQ